MMKNQPFRRAFAIAALGTGLCAAASVAAAQGNTFPGGATSINESHGDWTVACRVTTKNDKDIKSCAMSQQRLNKQHQRALEISLVPQASGGARGVILMPFGLAVTKTVQISVGGTGLGAPLSFSTCVPLGCLVPLDLTPAEIKTMSHGTKLQIDATAADGQALTVSASLDGFSNAFSRTVDLLK